MSLNYGGRDGLPGINAVRQTYENAFLWGDWQFQLRSGLIIDGAARDSGNVGSTHILRAGLIMGQVTATKKLKQWDITAVDGTEYPWGILHETRSMLSNGASTDRFTGPIIVSGGLLAERIWLGGETSIGLDADTTKGPIARALLRENFKINDDYQLSHPFYMIHTVTAAERTSGLTLTAADNYTEYQNTGGTLAIALGAMVPAKGLEFRFRSEVTTTDNITITSGSSNIKIPGSVAASTLVTDSAIHRIYGNGTLWCVEILG